MFTKSVIFLLGTGLIYGCTFISETHFDTKTSDVSSASTGTGDTSSVSASASSGTGGSGGANSCSTNMNECLHVEHVGDDCIFTEEPTTKQCLIKGNAATCDGNGTCGGTPCFFNSDCPVKEDLTWHCVGVDEVSAGSADFHTCKYVSKDTSSCVISAHTNLIEACGAAFPLSVPWLCNNGDEPKVIDQKCVLYALGSQSTWCCNIAQ